MKTTWRPALLWSVVALGAATSPGCGGGERETGTQVEVSDEMRKEAEASSNFMESQSKKPRK